MGRYDVRPARVRQAAAMLLNSRRITQQPPWFQIMHDVPPSENLVRTQPVQHIDNSKRKKTRKPSSLFQPQRITYTEDELRADFFKDHPWELARPRVLLENDGKDHERYDWSKDYQPGRPRNGESVIQRQKWLMTNPTKDKEIGGRIPPLSKDAAYDQARKELYEQRHYDEVEARVAREEALWSGGYFGKSRLEIGMELENATFNKFRIWAGEEVTKMEQLKSAAYTGIGAGNAPDELEEPQEQHEDGEPLNTAADLTATSIPDSRGTAGVARGAGGAAFIPAQSQDPRSNNRNNNTIRTAGR